MRISISRGGKTINSWRVWEAVMLKIVSIDEGWHNFITFIFFIIISCLLIFWLLKIVGALGKNIVSEFKRSHKRDIKLFFSSFLVVSTLSSCYFLNFVISLFLEFGICHFLYSNFFCVRIANKSFVSGITLVGSC